MWGKPNARGVSGSGMATPKMAPMLQNIRITKPPAHNSMFKTSKLGSRDRDYSNGGEGLVIGGLGLGANQS